MTRWLPGFLALSVIWGASFLFIKVGVEQLHPMYVALGRVGAGALTLLVVMLVTRDRLPRGPRLWGHFAVVAMIGNVIPFTLFGYGEQRVSSVLAGIWNAVTPLIVLPVAVFLFRTERLNRHRVAGILLGFAGVLVVLGVWQGVGGSALTGQLMCLGAAGCYGFAIPYMRRFLAGRADSGVSLSAAQLIAATVELAVLAPLLAGPPPDLATLRADVLTSVAALGVLGTGLAFVLNMRVIRVAGASTAATVTYVVPVFATIIGVIALHETLEWFQPVGALIVLLGVAVSQGAASLLRRRAGDAVAVPAVAGQSIGVR